MKGDYLDNELIKVGEYNVKFNELLGEEIELQEIFMSKGLPAHILKRKHYKALEYIEHIPEIIRTPDYIGINPNEKGQTLELIKCYKNNILLGIKVDFQKHYLYVSTMHDIQQSKINRRLHSGRIKRVIDNSVEG